MKNKLYENRIRKAKEHARNSRWKPTHPKEKIQLIHVYDEPTREKSYWDDFKTKVNDQFVMIYYEHPRYVYRDRCESLAWDELEKELPYRDDIFKTTPCYTNAGKSRKRVKWYEVQPPEEYSLKRMTRLSEIEDFILNDENNGIVIKCDYSIEQMNWSRSLDIVANREILTEADAIEFVMDCKDLVKRKIAFSVLNDGKDFYDVFDWKNEK
jgi:hypothetical protein